MTYPSVVAADAPKWWWRLADPAGVIAHSFGSAVSPQFVHPSAYGLLGYTGISSDGGSAITTDTSYLQTVSPLAIPVALFSVELWMWPTEFTGVSTFFWGWDGNAVQGPFGFVNATGHVQMNYNGGAVLDPVVLNPNMWHHLVLTYDGIAIRGYKDGTLFASTAIGAAGAQSLQFLIGRRAGTGNQMNAAIAEVAVYTAALSAAQVSAHNTAADFTGFRPIWRGSGGLYPNGTGGGGTNPTLANVTTLLQAATDRDFHNAP